MHVATKLCPWRLRSNMSPSESATLGSWEFPKRPSMISLTRYARGAGYHAVHFRLRPELSDRSEAMNRIISLPEELLQKAEELAAREHLPVEQYLSATLAEQFAGLEYLKQRADRASDEKFRAALRTIPD